MTHHRPSDTLTTIVLPADQGLVKSESSSFESPQVAESPPSPWRRASAASRPCRGHAAARRQAIIHSVSPDPLIDELCTSLQRETEQYGGPQIVAAQVKEKFGRLRFRALKAPDRQRALIVFGGDLSERICEICGAPTCLNERPETWVDARCELYRGA